MLTVEEINMKTSAIEVHEMLSVLSVDEVEKRTGDVPGLRVHRNQVSSRPRRHRR